MENSSMSVRFGRLSTVPLRASRVDVHKLKERCDELKIWPKPGHLRPEFGRDIRSFPIGQIIIFYRASHDEQEVEILRVVDGRRDLGTVFFSPLVAA